MQTIHSPAEPFAPRRGLRHHMTVTALLACLAVLLVAAGMVYDLLVPNSSIFGSNNDFANYWIAGKLVIDGRTDLLFSGHTPYFDYMRSVFGPDYPWHSWSYPPSFLLIVWPLGLLGFDAAAILFQSVSLTFLFWSIYQGKTSASPTALLFLLPFLIVNLAVLQNGFLTAGLMLAGLNHRQHSPILAGVFFGLLTIKPQLGLLLPLLLIAEGNWRAIASASITALVMVGLSSAIFGMSAWNGYLGPTLAYQVQVMNQLEGDFLGMMPSLFGTLRYAGMAAEEAMRWHIIMATPVFITFLIGLWRLGDPDRRAQMTILSSFLISPYSLFYDFGAMSALAASQISTLSRGRRLVGYTRFCVLSLLILLPLIAYVALATKTSFAYAPILLAGLVICWMPRRPQDVADGKRPA